MRSQQTYRNLFDRVAQFPFPLLLVVLMSCNTFIISAADEFRAQRTRPDHVDGLTLRQCLDIAMENNQLRPISRYALEIAEAQHKQALSSYWPQLMLKGSYTIMDEDPMFVFPGTKMTIPSQSVTLPANAFGPGMPPQNVSLQSPPTTYKVPDQKVKLMDREVGSGSLNVTYPLFTGGQRGAIVDQAKAGIAIAKQEIRRSELEIAYDVKRMYYGAVMARELLAIGRETTAQMEATLKLTERLYQSGSGKVQKTDFLRNKVVLDGFRSALALLEANHKIALSALTNAMGLDWQTTISLAPDQIPSQPIGGKLEELVDASFEFNPDWAKIEAGLDAAAAKIREARSEHLPKVGFFGSIGRIFNSYDKGIVNADNKNNWSVGIGFQVPLFSGFRTRNAVKEAQARLAQMKHQQIRLSEAITLQVKMYFLQMSGAYESSLSLTQAAANAEENRKLFIRAYQEEMAETKDVIEAQLLEAFMKAQHQKALFDHMQNEAELELVVGKDLAEQLALN